MAGRTAVRRFVAQDEAGRDVVVLAERMEFERANVVVSRGPWVYRTEDGRAVSSGPTVGRYTIRANGERLTTSDPRAPQADAGV